MQDLANELPRIPFPRTSVNKGKMKGRGCSRAELTEKAESTIREERSKGFWGRLFGG